MTGPLSITLNINDNIIFLIYFFIGIGFGFFLERGGFGNSRKLALQFYFRDMTVFKVMFTAIVTGMIGMTFMNSFGWIDLNLIYLNPTYLWPGIAGGLIMGIGFAVGGYCPGTSVVGLATLKQDAVFYIMGSLFGMFVFGEFVPVIKNFFYSGFMGPRETIYKTTGLTIGQIGFFVIVMALLGFIGAEKAEAHFGKKEN
ncbi:MAG: YeeE/YedE thiosulfate transporter family protein [Acidobacteriota bacterium]